MSWELHEGDCLPWLAGLDAGSVDLICTDPPYGIGYHHGSQPADDTRPQIDWGSIEGDEGLDPSWLPQAFRVLKEGGALYLCTRWDVEPEWRGHLSNAGFEVKQRLTWHKRANGKGDLKGTYAPTTEDVLFATKGRHILKSRPSSLLDVGNVWSFEFRFHPHQKPVALSMLLILASSAEGDVVVDTHAGSGSTGVAALKTGRRFKGCEIDPKYARIARRRLREAEHTLFPSRPADLPGQGSLFPEEAPA